MTREDGRSAAGISGAAAGRQADALPCCRWTEHFGTLISVRAADDAILDSLAAFYAPYYLLAAGPPPRQPDLTLCLVVTGTPSAPALTTDMRAYLTRPEHLAWVDGRRVMTRHTVDIAVTVDPGQTRISILGARSGEVELQARVLLRDQLLRRLERARGAVVLHAAAASRAGKGVAVAGERNAGKTTALISMLMTKEYDFVTADRLTLTPGESHQPVRVAGVPARANIHAVAFSEGEPLEGLAATVDRATAVEGKILVGIDTLTGHFGVGVAPQTELRTVVFPRISPHAADPVVETVVDPEQVVGLVRQNLLEADVPGNSHVQWLDIPLGRAEPDDARSEQILRRIAEHCDVVTFSGSHPDYVAWMRHRFGGDHG